MSTYLPPNVSPVGHPSRRPLTGRRVLLLAALFLFVPPLGIAVLWWRRGSATVGRIIATVLAGLWSLIWLVAIIRGPSQPADPTTVRFANVVDTASRAATSPMSATSSTPAPLPTTSVPAAPVVASPPTVVAPPATTAEVETSAPAQQPSTPIAPVQTAPAPVTTPPAATAPAAPPPSITVVPGAYCSDSEAGQTGFSDAGKRYVCTLYPSNGRYRWKPA